MLAGGAIATLAGLPALGATPAETVAALADKITPVAEVNKGDTAWLLVSSLLVLMMAIPGLALFYGGLVRTKNMLSILTQVFAIVSIVTLLWVFYGYSMAFTGGNGASADFVGGFSKIFLKGIAPEGKTIADGMAATFTNGVYVPELAYMAFQMTFACITPALIIGAFAERMKFSALVLFVVLWMTVIYFPIAHMVWYNAGPDGFAKGALVAKLFEGSAADLAAAAKEFGDTAAADLGLVAKWGAIDFAGGTVVHINAGIAGFVGCILLGKRIGYGKELMAPHSLTMTMIGAALLWVGWFGFNAGSNLEANGVTALAFVNTFVATAAAAVSWLFVEWAAKGKPSLLGMVSGAVAGLVAVTPASGFGGPMGCIVLGLVAGAICFLFCSSVKNAFGYDDSLDVFGVHCIGGIVGAIGTGILVAPSLGGTGITDYSTCKAALAGGAALPPLDQITDAIKVTFSDCGSGFVSISDQLFKQTKAVGLTLLWSGIGSAILYKIVDVIIGLRVTTEVEREGLDIAEHGERAYNY
ncbi:MAG: ammonium transporter [Beijerinckiaceae bacterium]|nr:ammonium transporter [Beijerinckiaceae bacterium]